MKKSGRYHLNEIIKVNNIGTNQQHTSPHKAQNGLNTTSVGFLPEVHHLNLIMIKHLLLLLSRVSRVRLCATRDGSPRGSPRPWDSPGKNTGVGCHFLLQCMKVKRKWSRSVVSDSLRPHGLQPSRLLCPWDFPGKSTGVGCHHLLRIKHLGKPKLRDILQNN